MADSSRSSAPIWLRAVGALALLAIVAPLLYALAIGLANFSRIGV
jgi:hypothetical protein